METKLVLFVCLFVAERTRLAFTRVLGRRVAATVLLEPEPFGQGLTASVQDSCAERKECLFTGVYYQFWRSLEEGAGERGSECAPSGVPCCGM